MDLTYTSVTQKQIVYEFCVVWYINDSQYIDRVLLDYLNNEHTSGSSS